MIENGRSTCFAYRSRLQDSLEELTGESIVRFKIAILIAIAGPLWAIPSLAEDVCTIEVLGVRPGMDFEAASREILSRGFRSNGGAAGSEVFTKADPEPELTREQRAYAGYLRDDPRRAEALLAMFENDPEMTQLLSNTQPLPPPSDSIQVRLTDSSSKGATRGSRPQGVGIIRIHVSYSFPNDGNAGRVKDLSPQHVEQNKERWRANCGDDSTMSQPDISFQSAESQKICSAYAQGATLRINANNTQASGKLPCSYSYRSDPTAATEMLQGQ